MLGKFVDGLEVEVVEPSMPEPIQFGIALADEAGFWRAIFS